jgi:hypothetical protein
MDFEFFFDCYCFALNAHNKYPFLYLDATSRGSLIHELLISFQEFRIDPQGLRQRRCKDLVVKGRDGEFEAYFGH